MITRCEAADFVEDIAAEYYNFAHSGLLTGFSDRDWLKYLSLQEAADLLRDVDPEKEIKNRPEDWQ